MENQLKPFVNDFYKALKLNSVSTELKDYTALKFDALIFNIVSLICTISLIQGEQEITDKSFYQALKYIQSTCSKSKSSLKRGGGTVGVPLFDTNLGYAAGAGETINIGNIDFSAGIARQAINFSGGGDGLKIPIIDKSNSLIKNVITHFKVSTTDKIINDIKNVLQQHIECLASTILLFSKSHDILTLSDLKTIIEPVSKSGKNKNKQFAVFN